MKKLIIILAMVSFVASSCKKDPKDPIDNKDKKETITKNATIADLLKLSSKTYTRINKDMVIEGIVTGNDKTGNFYKALVIEDKTGGILIRVGGRGLATTYPEGQKVFVKCAGLYIGEYAGLPQLAISDDKKNEIPEALIKTYVFTAEGGSAVTPKVVSMDDLNKPELLNTLIQLNDVQVTDKDMNKTYADAAGKKSVNINVMACDGKATVIRSSGYATFAGANVAKGKGTLVGVLSTFNGTSQITLRDLNDVKMDGARCKKTEVGKVKTLNEPFDTDPTLKGWIISAEKGTRNWLLKTYKTEKYMQASAYKSTDTENESWLITPALDLDVDKTFTFKTAQNYWTHDGLTVYTSTNFDGKNIAGATWVPLSATLVDKNTKNTFVPSGNITLAKSAMPTYVAFKYVGNATNSKTGTFRVDDVVMVNRR